MRTFAWLTVSLLIIPFQVAFAQDAAQPTTPEATPEAAQAPAAEAKPQDPMEALFGRKCASCHTVGKGKRVGPDLKNAHQRRDAAWLKRFIQTPSSMLDSDPDARAMVKEYNNVRMPDLGLSDEEATAMVEIIERCSTQTCNLSPAFTPVTKAVQADFDAGEALFLGHTRLENGAPPCVACHTVQGVGGFIPGGELAKDLTNVFARLGDEGLDAALRNPAFPLMNKVFTDHPLAETEVFALRAFLYDANRREPVAGDSLSLLLVGILGALLALALLNAAWSRRLRGVRKPLTRPPEAIA